MQQQNNQLQQKVQDVGKLVHSLRDQIDVLETQRSIDSEENIPKKSDCNGPLSNTVQVNDPSPPFSEFKKQERKLSKKERKKVTRLLIKLEMEKKEQRERIEKEQQDIDKKNAERKVQKNSYKTICIMVFITLCLTNFTLRIIMEVCGLVFLLKVFLTLIENNYPLSPNVSDNMATAAAAALNDNNMICNVPTCPAETCKQIRYAGLRRQNRFFTP